MELSLDMQFAIFEMSYDMNIYFKKLLLDDYLLKTVHDERC